jgi:hypothetical protein
MWTPCDSRLSPLVVATAAVWLLSAPLGYGAQPPSPLSRARHLYNEHHYDAAIAAAEEARSAPDRADGADLIAARAYLERFRDSAESEDLRNARARLKRINANHLSADERFELIVGLGEALYFDESPGAAADVFELVVSKKEGLELGAHERVLDWWASAVDAEARPKPDIERQALYQKIRDRMRNELSADPRSAAASYWLSAAARGQGDLVAAWEAAEAGWVLAPLASDRGAALREDLDELVQRAIAPERARAMAQPPDTLLMEWEQFKGKWQK